MAPFDQHIITIQKRYNIPDRLRYKLQMKFEDTEIADAARFVQWYRVVQLIRKHFERMRFMILKWEFNWKKECKFVRLSNFSFLNEAEVRDQ